MPKAPILSRTRLYETLRDGSFRNLDWNLVNTTLGAMMEPVSIVMGPITQRDPYDESFTDRMSISGDQQYQLMGTGGQLWPRTFNTL